MSIFATARPSVKPPRPAAGQVGTLGQQITAIVEFLGDPLRNVDRDGAWRAARARAMPHATRPQKDYAQEAK